MFLSRALQLYTGLKQGWSDTLKFCRTFRLFFNKSASTNEGKHPYRNEDKGKFPYKGKIRNHSNDVQPTKGTTQRNQISHTIFPFAIYNYYRNIFLHRKVFVWNKCTIYCRLLKPTIEEPSLMCTLWSWRAGDSPQTTMHCDNCIKNTITIQSANLCTALHKNCQFSPNSIRYLWIADTNFVWSNYLSKATCLVPLIVPHATIFYIIFNYSEKRTKETRYSCPA
jgi:hypothetical protein